MEQLHPTRFSSNNNDVQEILPFGATMEDSIPSFSSILGADNDDAIGIPPETLYGKISAINEFYQGMEAPYISAEALIRKTLMQRQDMLAVSSLDKKQRKAAEVEIAELQDSLGWALKKINVLEDERKTLISKLQ